MPGIKNLGFSRGNVHSTEWILDVSIEQNHAIIWALLQETALPISLEHHYRFLVLLPLEASEKMEVLKHYFGITHNNELIARGIKIRRHDVPNFITQFQTELLCTLFDCKDIGEVMSKDMKMRT